MLIPIKSNQIFDMSLIPTKWGFCMAGNEAIFCEMLLKANTRHYIEVGIGRGDTLLAVDDFLKANGITANIYGVDLPYLSSLDLGRPNITLYLSGDQEGASMFAKGEADFIFIDACHGAPCVTNDFNWYAPLLRIGGIMAFHDTDPACQGTHAPQHCGTGIDVRRALHELGLLDGSRPGWQLLAETQGDKSQLGHGCVFIQKTASK